jgi:copper chaperone CopZ
MMESTASLLTSLLIVFGFFSVSLAQNKTTSDQAETSGGQITLHIEGMVCSMCEQNCKKALEKLEGVNVESISAEKGIAKLTYTGSNPINDKTLKESVENAGYNLEKVQWRDTNESDDKTDQ